MNLKDHILAALSEEFNQWEELLTRLSEEQIISPQLPSTLSTKDVIAHVLAWQQVSITRMEAAVLNREPAMPPLPPAFDFDAEHSVDGINAWFYETYRDQPWSSIYGNWRAGFLRFLQLGGAIGERDLLDSDRYPWLQGRPLVFVLVASYDHHHEHLDGLRAWLQEHGNSPS